MIGLCRYLRQFVDSETGDVAWQGSQDQVTWFDLVEPPSSSALLVADLIAARTLLRQATRGGRSMPGHEEGVGGVCACATCQELRRLTGFFVGRRNDGG